MASCNTRVRYGTKRYNNDSSMQLGDTRGWKKSNGDQIGNYGAQFELHTLFLFKGLISKIISFISLSSELEVFI